MLMHCFSLLKYFCQFTWLSAPFSFCSETSYIFFVFSTFSRCVFRSVLNILGNIKVNIHRFKKKSRDSNKLHTKLVLSYSTLVVLTCSIQDMKLELHSCRVCIFYVLFGIIQLLNCESIRIALRTLLILLF